MLYQTNEQINHPHLSGYIWFVISTNNTIEKDGFIKRILTNTYIVKHLHLSYDEKPEIPEVAKNIRDNQALIISKVN